MATIETPSGTTIYYEEHGAGEPLLCVHGLATDTLGWLLQIPAFAERHRTIVFDNRDVGQSSMAGDEYEVTDMAADALALADALELETFHLLGVSMGGAISQEMALAAPERIRTLTLAVTFASAGAWGASLANSWGTRVRRSSLEERVEEFLLLTLSEELFEDAAQVETLRNLMLQNPHPQDPEGFCRQLNASSRHNTRDRLASLTMPVHVIAAERDILVPIWKSEEIASLIAGSKLTVMERAPHGVQAERAQEFNQVVLDFIAEHEPATV